MDYDAWRLAGPEECTEPDVVTCDQCDGSGMQIRFDGDPGLCSICHGDGVMPVEVEEPDGDNLYERRRDAAMED